MILEIIVGYMGGWVSSIFLTRMILTTRAVPETKEEFLVRHEAWVSAVRYCSRCPSFKELCNVHRVNRPSQDEPPTQKPWWWHVGWPITLPHFLASKGGGWLGLLLHQSIERHQNRMALLALAEQRQQLEMKTAIKQLDTELGITASPDA